MAKLVKCSGCRKKISESAPECPSCGAIYFTCRRCEEAIAPEESFCVPHNLTNETLVTFIGRVQTCFHISCLIPQKFLSSRQLKCLDCGHSVRCQNISLDSFLTPLRSFPYLGSHPHSYTRLNDWSFLNIACSNCGRPDSLGQIQACGFCGLPIIPAIHKYEENHDGVRRHSFCSISRVYKQSQIRNHGCDLLPKN